MYARQKEITWLLIFTFGNSTLCNGITSPRIEPGMGVIQVGRTRTVSEKKALDLVGVRLRRWIENTLKIRARVKNIGVIVDESEFASEMKLFEIRGLLRELGRDRIGESNISRTEILSEIRRLVKLRSIYPGVLREGSLIQEAFVWESVLAWHESQRATAQRLAIHAIRLHPKARLSLETFRHATEVLGFRQEFESMIRQQIQEVKRDCELFLALNPAGAKVWINGFIVPNGQRIFLDSMTTHKVRVAYPGYRRTEKVLECGQQGKWFWSMNLEQVNTGSQSVLSDLAESDGNGKSKSYFFIRHFHDDVLFYLYTPGLSLDEIPLEGPIRLTQVLSDPLDSSLPIVSDAFVRLVEKHRLASASLFFREQGGPMEDSLLLKSDLDISSNIPVYKSWTFWVVAGGILGGILVAHLAAKNRSIETQHRNLSWIRQ